jgi:hypothetical protein
MTTKQKAVKKSFFEREPDNDHDTNAIRVENLDFKNVGFLPKKSSSWLTAAIMQIEWVNKKAQ